MITRLSLLFGFIGLIVLFFGLNESNNILMIAGITLLFAGFIGGVYAYNTKNFFRILKKL